MDKMVWSDARLWVLPAQKNQHGIINYYNLHQEFIIHVSTERLYIMSCLHSYTLHHFTVVIVMVYPDAARI